MAGGQQEHFRDWPSDVLAAALLCRARLPYLQNLVCISYRKQDYQLQEFHPAGLLCTSAGRLLCAPGNIRLNIVQFAFSRTLCVSFWFLTSVLCKPLC